MSSYSDRLNATKVHFPFERWASMGDTLEQYTEENCATAAAILDRLISQLVALGEFAGEPAKLEAFREAVEALNMLNEENYQNLIETEEREELCELFDVIASAAGLDPGNYAGGEGLASLWRDW